LELQKPPVVPDIATLALIGTGLAGLGSRVRKQTNPRQETAPL